MSRSMGWFYLAHLGYNMWVEPLEDKSGVKCKDVRENWSPYIHATDHLLFEKDYWKELTAQLRDAGCTAILLDVGEGLRFESHPELAVEGSWSKQELSEELSRLRGMGFAVYPKLNFSASHDQWLGEYSRMLSTSVYHRVTADLIAETAELFGRPELFHLGMDEETAEDQKYYNYAVIRQGDQWWYDFNKLLDATRAAGSRPWIWSDYGWSHPDELLKRMPRDVVQSNWYYGDFNQKDQNSLCVRLYDVLDKAGFDQIPTGSSWARADNFSMTAAYCKEHIASERLLGLMQTPWKPTVRATSKKHTEAIVAMAEVIRSFDTL